MLQHIIVRAFEHIFMDLGLVVGAFALLETFEPKQLPSLQSRLLAACLIVGLIVAGREAIDLHAGQVYAKVWTDWTSHIIGIGGGWIAARWLIKKEWKG
jgi:membrane associated rhomboid family serine protease